MKNYLANWKESFSAVQKNEEGADIVQTIIIMVLLVVAAVVIIGLIYNAVRGQAERVTDCLANADPIGNNDQSCGTGR